jgi:hypothetical protein
MLRFHEEIFGGNVCVSGCAEFQTGATVPLDLRILRILLPGSGQYLRFKFAELDFNIPVTTLTWATPWESRRTTPIWDGVAPFLASLQICSTTCSGVVFNQAGAVRLYGRAEAEMPFPLLCMRPILNMWLFRRTGSKMSVSGGRWSCRG